MEGRILIYSPGWPRTLYVDKLVAIHLPQSSQCWNYSPEPHGFFFFFFNIYVFISFFKRGFGCPGTSSVGQAGHTLMETCLSLPPKQL